MGNPTPTSNAGTAAPHPILLWSTNTDLKYRIQQRFRGGRHHVWCSPAFEGRTLGRYAIGANQPASSDPCTIYKNLRAYCEAPDSADPKVTSQKSVLNGLAVTWLDQGLISEQDQKEIVAMVALSNPQDWRPLLFVIPFHLVGPRVKLVPRDQRASHEPEYIISDLADGEFQIVEMPR